MNTDTITVSKTALQELLLAVIGPGHHIREMQATRSLHQLGHPNAIETLVQEFNNGGAGPVAPAQLDVAARKLAELFDYPWDHMPEHGRQTMRNHVVAVLEAAR